MVRAAVNVANRKAPAFAVGASLGLVAEGLIGDLDRISGCLNYVKPPVIRQVPHSTTSPDSTRQSHGLFSAEWKKRERTKQIACAVRPPTTGAKESASPLRLRKELGKPKYQQLGVS